MTADALLAGHRILLDVDLRRGVALTPGLRNLNWGTDTETHPASRMLAATAARTTALRSTTPH